MSDDHKDQHAHDAPRDDQVAEESPQPPPAQETDAPPRRDVVEEIVIEATEPAAPAATGHFPTPVLFIVMLCAAASYMLFKLVRLRIAERIKRWAPLGHVIIWGLGLLLSGAVAIRTTTTEWLAFGLLLVGVIVTLNLNWLRSVLAGVALTFEHHLEVGDSVRIEELEGDIVHFGLRATRIRAVDGTLHDIPNDHLLTQHVANLSGDGSDSACKILIAIPSTLNVAEASALALQAAILSPLASPRHRPEVFLRERTHPDDPLQLHIRGYAFDPNYQDHFRSDVISRVMKAFDEREQRGTLTSSTPSDPPDGTPPGGAHVVDTHT